MTAPAQAPTAQPAPATPDELAALYLRARDVPCPGCGYNRRDGSGAACPECEHMFAFSVSQGRRHATIKVNGVRFTFGLLLAASLTTLCAFGSELWWYLNMTMLVPGQYAVSPGFTMAFPAGLASLGMLAALPALYYAFSMNASQSNPLRTGRSIVRCLAWLSVSILPYELYELISFVSMYLL